MDLKARLVEGLESIENSLHLLHLMVQNWVIFQRDRFDFFDENNDPFTTQIFLFEFSTGKYIHRVQGRVVDVGRTWDMNILYEKLTEAFVESKVCSGYPLKSQAENMTSLCIEEFPYKRRVSQKCQYLFKPKEQGGSFDDKEDFRWVCPKCQESWSNESTVWDSLFVNQNVFKAVMNEPIELFPSSEIKSTVKSEENSPMKLESVDNGVVEEEEEDENEEGSHSMDIDGPENTKIGTIDDDGKEMKDKPAKKTYFCYHCSETFHSPDSYQKHQRKKRKVTCKMCNKERPTFKELLKHVHKSHPEVVGKYMLQVQNPEEVKSMKVPRKCSLCDMICNGNVLLYRHREIYHELGDYKCSTCQAPCLTYYDLAIHTYQEHDQALQHIQPQTHGLVEQVSSPDGKVEYKRAHFACQHCKSSFPYDSGWTLHMRQKHSWGLFECKTCDETCHYATDFSAHMLAFHPENPEIKCPNEQCSHVSNLSQNPKEFNLHYGMCDQSTKSNTGNFSGKYIKQGFQCETCGKKYTSKYNFDAHVNLHQGIERFKCSFCEFGTNTKSILIDHEKCHLREKGLTNADTNLILYHHCDQCEKQYSTKQALKSHIKSVHKGMPIVKQCKDCEKTFHSSSALYFHKRKAHGFVNTLEVRTRRSKRKK